MIFAAIQRLFGQVPVPLVKVPYPANERLVHVHGPDSVVQRGVYHLAWQRRPLPDPGALNYAFEGEALPAFCVDFPNQSSRKFQRVMSTISRPSFAGAVVVAQGLPTQTGAIYSQPLYVPPNPAAVNATG